MERGEVGSSKQGGSRRDWQLQARQLQARSVAPSEAVSCEIVGTATAQGWRSRLRMREEENESKEEKRKADKRESFKGVRGEKREGRVD